ncbi:LysR family transcriptional regulator [Marivita sp. GX14005]|uniref:LysR family transcriptional regulator n=1 Tax=Marivita sp. GX14005 TaxID=2942276 RepID=UPI0020185220|nr:LysR family transcriptional regulator [Marivita sp. GX14005]MCL3881482.1 LysR family transcriptional regulator [Marivita sp. GX14005]
MSPPIPTPKLTDADIKLLSVFKTVAECGGVSAAEPALNIGRSTISKYLSDLEIRLGLRLCSRGPAGFHLTEEGLQVLSACDDLFDSVSTFSTRINEVRCTLAGTLRLGAFDHCITNEEARLSSALRLFSERAPDVSLEMSLLTPNQIELQLIQGTLDIGIIAMHRPSPMLDYLPVHSERMYLYCGRAHPFFDREPGSIEPEEIHDTSYAGISFNSPNLIYGQKLGLDPKALVQNEVMLAALIISGRYIGFMPDHMAAPFERAGQMRRILAEDIHYQSDYGAATRRAPEPSRVTRVFLECLRKCYAEPSRLAVPAGRF